MSSPQQSSFSCDCGKSYATSSSLQQHQRRYCRGARSTTSDDGECSVCHATFRTYQGMRLHLQKMHKAEYNGMLQEENKNGRRAWTVDEINQLAQAEAEYSGNSLLNHLERISLRSKDAIKGRRRHQEYKRKVDQFKELLLQERSQTTNSPGYEPITSRHTSPVSEARCPPSPLGEIDSDEVLRTSPLLSSPGICDKGSNTSLGTPLRETEGSLRYDRRILDYLNSIPVGKIIEADAEFRRILCTGPKEDAIKSFDGWCADLIKRSSKKSNTNNRRGSPLDAIKSKIDDSNISKRKKRPLEYKLAQLEYQRDRTSYARRLLDGVAQGQQTTRPRPEDLESLYKGLFGSISPPDSDEIRDKFKTITDISHPISSDDISNALKATKTNTPGPDGLTTSDIRRMRIESLVLLFNAVLYLEYIPGCFKSSNTVLIPKTKDDLHLTKNWRPISISSILLRLMNKILASRLSKIKISNRQRGFSKIDGCFANFATLETVISHYKKKGRPLSIISLDLAKAFDSVSHQSIIRAAARLNIDVKAQNIIAENYRGLETTIHCGNEVICTCLIKRGVKQGDPMSPFLFNAVIDELLQQLEASFSGIKIGTTTVSCLAFADDLVLFSNTPEDGQRMLDFSIRFFDKRGLQVNADKCRSLVFKTVASKKKIYIPTGPVFHAKGVDIPLLDIGEEFRYLGQTFDTEGLTKCNSSNLVEQLQRVRHAPLKPQQKLCIIRDHLIPRYIAVLQRPKLSKKLLQKVDRTIRSALKAILHLNSHCSNAIFYARVRCGGLGIFEFAKMIPIITLSRWERLKDWNELLSQTYNLSESWVRRMKKMIQPEMDSKEKVHQHQEQLLQESFSGGGIWHAQNHPACNFHIWRAPRYWSGEDFVRAVLLRFNLLPCLGIPSNPINLRRCRARCDKVESLSHILQGCPITHWCRIERHDHVVRRIANFAKNKGWQVSTEPRIRCTDGSLKKPDLILEKDNRVIVSDVGIHWEGSDSLDAHFYNKVCIYSTEPFVQRMQTLYEGKEIVVLPIIIGARGGWCRENNVLLDQLQLSNSNVADLITTTIRGSCIIHQQFMRQVWRQRQPQSR